MSVALTADQRKQVEEYIVCMEKRNKYWNIVRWLHIAVGIALLSTGIFYWYKSSAFIEDSLYMHGYHNIYNIHMNSVEYEMPYLVSVEFAIWYCRFHMVGLLSIIIGIACIAKAFFAWNRPPRDSIMAKILREKLDEERSTESSDEIKKEQGQ